MEITQGLLKELFDYSPHTGHLIRRQTAQGRKIGDRVGFVGAGGYRRLKLLKEKRQYLEHRIIWLYVYGRWPVGQIDHINGNKEDNRIENLREVSNRENSQNKTIHRNGKLVGACFDKNSNKWQSSIQVGKKLHFLGRYNTQQEAHEAYLKALEKINQVLTK